MKKPAITLFLATISSVNADVLINCDRLIDGVSSSLQAAKTIQVSDNRIVTIHDQSAQPEGQHQIINLGDVTCMPGLIDAHVHITSQQSPNRFSDRFSKDPADKAFATIPYAEKTLMSGFTTVRDLGSSDNLSINMRDAINNQHIIGPRIFTAGKSLATTGGHADPTNGNNQKLRGNPGPKEGVVNSADDVRKAVRQRYKDRADLIKITATGGVLSEASSGQNAQFTDYELDAIVSIAKDYGFKVAAHAHGTEGMKRAVAAGVDSIEHGTYMDLETMRLMKEKGTAYVPTIIAGKFVEEKSKIDGYFSETVKPKAATIGPLIQDTLTRAHQQGVLIVFGTDSGVSPHGDNWKEFGYMVDAGMSEFEALNAAMKPGATLLGKEAELGSLEKGKLADIIAVRGNPLEDISMMEHIQFVMKDGEIYKQH